MSRTRRILTVAAVAALALAAGVGLRYQLVLPDESAGAGEALLEASFEDLSGKRVSLSQFRGQVLVVNFWATWCTPCREEIPEFIEVQAQLRERGVTFVGIAVDRKEPVTAFSRELGINYPILIGSLDALALAQRAGNRLQALPFTVILDRSGQAAKVHLGRLSRDDLVPLLLQLI
jgi:thiol-disulfide isomerase/thioredoxin